MNDVCDFLVENIVINGGGEPGQDSCVSSCIGRFPRYNVLKSRPQILPLADDRNLPIKRDRLESILEQCPPCRSSPFGIPRNWLSVWLMTTSPPRRSHPQVREHREAQRESRHGASRARGYGFEPSSRGRPFRARLEWRMRAMTGIGEWSRRHRRGR
jgi:hypothetical protein